MSVDGGQRGLGIRLPEDSAPVLGWHPAEPTVVGTDDSIDPDTVLEHDIAHRSHAAVRKPDLGRATGPTMAQFAPPRLQRRAEVAKTLEGVEIGKGSARFGGSSNSLSMVSGDVL